MSGQLAKLAQPIDQRFVEKKPGKYEADYVSHGVVAQYLIGILGRVPQQEIVREIYDDGKLTGCVLRLTLTIDGKKTLIEEAGAASNPMDETNGDRLKSATSDAYKRAAMRAGCALSLWAGGDMYFLHKVLSKEAAAPTKQSNLRGGVDASGPAVADVAPPHPQQALMDAANKEMDEASMMGSSKEIGQVGSTDDGGTRGGGPSSVAQGRMTRIYQLAKAAGVDAAEFARSEQLLAEDEPLDVLMDSDRIVSSSKLAARLEALGRGKKK